MSVSASHWLDCCKEEWIPNHNKITVGLDQTYSRELFQRPQARVQFCSYMGQLMLQKAGGYVNNLEWSHQFGRDWGDKHPAVALSAARQSPYPPDQVLLWKWVRLHYPSWLVHFWPPRHSDKVFSDNLCFNSGLFMSAAAYTAVPVDLHAMD